MATTMTFEMVRCGWPNIMAVVALAAVPFLSLGMPDEQRVSSRQIECADEHPAAAEIGRMLIAAEQE
jgi:hypothetical protein